METDHRGTCGRASSQMRIGCSVIVMTRARNTGPMMSAMDLAAASAMATAAMPIAAVIANVRPGRRSATVAGI